MAEKPKETRAVEPTENREEKHAKPREAKKTEQPHDDTNKVNQHRREQEANRQGAVRNNGDTGSKAPNESTPEEYTAHFNPVATYLTRSAQERAKDEEK